MTPRGFDAALARAWLAAAADAVASRREELSDLDAAIGDGDHGANLSRGFTAVTAALAAQAQKAEQAATDGAEVPGLSPGQVLTTAGNTLISKVGGASGPLYGSALRAIGKAVDAANEQRRSEDSGGDGDGIGNGNGPDCDGPSGANVLAALRAGLDAVVRLGGAKVGDKTMVDAYAPAIEAFEAALESGAALPAAAQAAADAAEKGAAGTVPLVARKGRASYLGERSAGHQDPGATSTALLFRALADVTNGRGPAA